MPNVSKNIIPLFWQMMQTIGIWFWNFTKASISRDIHFIFYTFHFLTFKGITWVIYTRPCISQLTLYLLDIQMASNG